MTLNVHARDWIFYCDIVALFIRKNGMHCTMQMPVKIIIRENGKQCMMQMPVKTTLRLYCDDTDSRLVFKCIQRHQCIATQLPCYYSFVHKNVIVKLREICMETGSTSSATKVIARYTRERGSPEANSGLSTSNLLLSLSLSLYAAVNFCLCSERVPHEDEITKLHLFYTWMYIGWEQVYTPILMVSRFYY